jgi:hypothetical protein
LGSSCVRRPDRSGGSWERAPAAAASERQRVETRQAGVGPREQEETIAAGSHCGSPTSVRDVGSSCVRGPDRSGGSWERAPAAAASERQRVETRRAGVAPRGTYEDVIRPSALSPQSVTARKGGRPSLASCRNTLCCGGAGLEPCPWR